MDEIKSFLINKVAGLCNVDPETITDETELIKDLGMKSATIVVLIADLENEYDVDIDFMKFRRALSIQDATELLDELVNG